MLHEITVLALTAASLGFVHTILGPDHYIPFIAMARAGKWSTIKTILITIACGAGHVLSTVLLGAVGIAMGIAFGELEFIESARGEIAVWLLIGFGFMYLLWGLKKAYRNKPHTHYHAHSDGAVHVHKHVHHSDHSHVHEKENNGKSLTPWILFTIFIFGPCEVLIPMLMYPAATESTIGIIVIVTVFAITTISTMLAIVLITLYGIKFIRLGKLERYTHALAGAMILLSGAAIAVLGL
jgi:sulfite exporter TauE/SafE